jgi:hypothetical protein
LSEIRWYAGQWDQWSEIPKFLTFQRPSTPNLWRMEAQRCVFLNSPLRSIDDSPIMRSVEYLYDLDRIFIRRPATDGTVNRERIYPKRKSDLERLLDQFFSIEWRLPGLEAFKSLEKDGIIKPFRFDGPGDYFLRPGFSPHSSWLASERAAWVEGTIEPEPNPATGEPFNINLTYNRSLRKSAATIAEQVAHAIETRGILRRRSETFTVCGSRITTTADRAILSVALADLWDGIRAGGVQQWASLPRSSTRPCRSMIAPRSSRKGHDGQFAAPRLSGRSRFSEETLAGRCGNEEDAPIAVVAHCRQSSRLRTRRGNSSQDHPKVQM